MRSPQKGEHSPGAAVDVAVKLRTWLGVKPEADEHVNVYSRLLLGPVGGPQRASVLVMVAARLAVTVIVKDVAPQAIEGGEGVIVSSDSMTVPVPELEALQPSDDVAVAVSV